MKCSSTETDMATFLDTLVFLCQLAAIAFLAWGACLSIREALAGRPSGKASARSDAGSGNGVPAFAGTTSEPA
jgi:hypothetical protein